MRIGVKGLPKRVIVRRVSDYGWGRDYVSNIINALARYQKKPFVDHILLSDLLKDEYAIDKSHGIRLRRYANGNAHMYFNQEALRDINKALAEYYGEVIADCTDENETLKPQQSTAVSKDLQYYPTPKKIVDFVLDGICGLKKDQSILEPSCGCGRFLDALAQRGVANLYGIEVDPQRASLARSKGHSVYTGNFLECVPTPKFDRVIMNPPFYGKHYAKHVEHALKFLKPGGTLTAILPITARYDHGLLTGQWEDLPVGSFSESGTNINTTILTIRAQE